MPTFKKANWLAVFLLLWALSGFVIVPILMEATSCPHIAAMNSGMCGSFAETVTAWTAGYGSFIPILILPIVLLVAISGEIGAITRKEIVSRLGLHIGITIAIFSVIAIALLFLLR